MTRRSIASALSKIRNERLGQATAAEQYEVKDENERIYEILSDDEYQRRNKSRKIRQFVEGADLNDEEEEYDFYDYEKPTHLLERKKTGKMKPLVQHFVEMARKDADFKKIQIEKSFEIEKYHALEMELDDENVDLGRKNDSKNGLFSHKSSQNSNNLKQNNFPHHTEPISSIASSSTFNRTYSRNNASIYSNTAPQRGFTQSIYQDNQINNVLDNNLENIRINTENRIINDDLHDMSKDRLATDYADIDKDYKIYDEINDAEADYPKVQPDTPNENVDVKPTDIYLLENQSIGIYCLDLQEGLKGNMYIFGKVITSPYTSDTVETASCCVVVSECMRNLYFKVRMDMEFTLDNSNTKINAQNALYQKMIMKGFYKELQELKAHYGIQKVMFKLVWRKVVQNGPCDQQLFIKVCYPYSFPEIKPEHYSGSYYTDIYGLNSSLVEAFAVKRKIKGPCWLKIKDAKVIGESTSRCQFEFFTKSYKSVLRWNYKDQDSKLPEPPLPRLCICSLSLKMISINNISEVFQVSMIYNKSARIDSFTFEMGNENQFVCVRKVGNKSWPNGMDRFCKTRPYICLAENERRMIALFFNKLQQIDPDILVSHDIGNNVIENMTKRAIAASLPQRISFSRFKLYKKWQTYAQGRLICDTRVLQKEFNPGQVSYELESLVKFDKWKPDENFSRTTFSMEDVEPLFNNLGKMLEFIQSSSKFAYYSLDALVRVQALTLTRELTCIAGNTWAHSLACMRSDRNDMLLLHEFHRLKYVISNDFQKRKEPKSTGNKKASYEGGLVLEPMLGLYDTFVLLLDFNSLYPSIIQEFNVCFTTAVISPMVDRNNELQVERILTNPGVLPAVLKRLVEMRSAVKSAIAFEKNSQKKAQMHVRQLALKLIANSLYGCLGSPYSRFHAQHLAAFITLQGRNILIDTKEKLESEFKLQVVYGDTDSLMLNTNIRHDGRIENFNNANQLATLLSSSINKKYRKLEIELDAIFARLLLLKKKKYAALKVIDYANKKLEIDSKGLDFVRRDWSLLTKEVGDKILNILFTMDFGDNGIDSAIEKIHELLTYLCGEMDSGRVPLESYIITKQLNRNPEEYSDASALSHVSVALRINKMGKRIIRAGQEISFIICSQKSIDSAENKSTKKANSANLLSQRAFTIEEVREKGLEPDLEYYKSVQLLPPVIRLCGNIEGTNSQRLGRCLGLTISENYQGGDAHGPQNSILSESSALSLIKRSIDDYRGLSLSVGLNCNKCGNMTPPEAFLQYLKCNNCKSWVPINSIRNWIQRVIFELDTNAAICTRRCTSCETTTQRVMIGAVNKCPQMTCQEQDTMEQFLTASKTFLYYDYIEYLLEGPLKEGPDDTLGTDKPCLVPVLIDPKGRVHPLDETPIKQIQISDYGELVSTLSKEQSVTASSGLKKMCPTIMSLISNAICLRLHILDYNKERKNLFSFVRNQQSRNGYSQIPLNLLFSPFATMRKGGRFELLNTAN